MSARADWMSKAAVRLMQGLARVLLCRQLSHTRWCLHINKEVMRETLGRLRPHVLLFVISSQVSTVPSAPGLWRRMK